MKDFLSRKMMPRRFVLTAIGLNVLVLLLAFCVLIGWFFDIQVLKSIFPGIVNMNPTTATCFILASSALVFIRSQKGGKKGRIIATCFASLIIFVGVSMLLKFITGFDIHVDQFIFRQKILAVTSFSNNRIAPNAALNQVLTGLALLFLIGRRFKLSQLFSFVTFSISLLAIVGYLYGVKNLYGILSYTPMALNTGLGFMMLSLSVAFSEPEQGFTKIITDDSLAGTFLRNLLPASIVIPLVLGELHLLGQQFPVYDKQFGLSLMIVLMVTIFFLIFYYVARTVNFLDEERQHSQKDLLQKTSELEKTKDQVERINISLDQKLKDTEKQNELLSGTKKAMLNLLEDLNEEKEKIQLERSKDEALLGSIGDAVFALDKEENIILFNPIAETLSGFTKEEALGKHYSDILHFAYDDSEKPNIDFIKIALGGTKTEMANHTILIAKNGAKVPVSDSAAPVRDGSGAVIGAVVVFRDVTEERKVDKAKTEFVSLASHQLRTPLTAINWYSELLLSGDAGKVSKDQKEFLNQIHDSNTRMVELVNSLLNVSRIDMGTLASDPEPTDIVKLSDSVISELTPQIATKKLVLTKKYPDIPVSLIVDPKLMRIIIQNLLSNAVKYTPEAGAIEIYLSTDSENMHFSVKDNGYGIPKSQQDKIFTKLFRADNAKEKETDGNGLGLYMVKSIVETHNGKIWFESEENNGTTFHVDLPCSGMKKIEGSRTLAS